MAEPEAAGLITMKSARGRRKASGVVESDPYSDSDSAIGFPSASREPAIRLIVIRIDN